MNDLISRQAAIDWLKNEWDGMVTSVFKGIENLPSAQPEPITVNIDHELTQEDYEKLRKDVANAPIMLLPSAQSKQRWIPCSERLPNHELAIVQYSDGGFDLLQFPTAYRRKDIVAWMSLPEPYKGE